MKKILTIAAMAALALPVMAQTDLVQGENVTFKCLGTPLTWSNGETSVTFDEASLEKLKEPVSNNDYVYLFPEVGALNTAENRELGAQVFYVDLGASYNIGTVVTTWEGAAASGYNIYVTTDEPTAATLQTAPAYTISGLGQPAKDAPITAAFDSGVEGQYVVFQATNAVEWAWGIKMGTMSVYEVVDDELGTFEVSPKIVELGAETELTVTLKNQLGSDITSGVDVSVTNGDATYSDGTLTVNSGTTVTLTATLGSISLEQVVFVATAPVVPNVDNIKTPIFTNGDTSENSTSGFMCGYNGGATDNGLITFQNDEVAQSFSNVKCIFFYNTVTTGGAIDAVNPVANGWGSLCLSVFSANDVDGYIAFEGVEMAQDSENSQVEVNNNFSLKAGEWNNIVVNVKGATKLNNMSIRFNDANVCDILLANIYFTSEASTVVKELNSAADGVVDVYTLKGVAVKKAVKAADALENLPKGIYIVGGKKVVK